MDPSSFGVWLLFWTVGMALGTTALTENYLYYANRQRLVHVNRDGSGTQIFTLNTTNAIAVDYDIRLGLMFWSDVSQKTISSAHLNGTGLMVLVNSGIDVPDGLAWDWVNRKLYWTDADDNDIEVIDPVTTHRKLLISTGSTTTPRAIVLDPQNKRMYWTDWGTVAKIERASMDGTSREVLHNTSLVWPNALTLDYDTQILYWMDASLDKFESSNADGSNRRLLSTTQIYHPFGITFYQNTVYWTDWQLNAILSAPISRPSQVTMVITGLTLDPMGISVVSVNRQPTAINPCASNNGGCSHLCLLSTAPGGHTCACPDGHGYQLAANQRDCIVPCPSGAIRLIGGSRASEGRVEVCFNNTWGTICDNGWTDVDASVVCRQLGYSSLNASAYSNAHFGQGTGPILLSDVDCAGNETRLVECQYSAIPNCIHGEDAGVSCETESLSSTAANDYCIGFMKNHNGPGTMTLYITTTESVPVPFTVSSSTGQIYLGTATNSVVSQVTLSSSFAVVDNTVRDKGVWIRATDATKTLTVHGMNYKTFTADGFLALPYRDYQKENYTYYAVTYQFVGLSGVVLLVGCEDSTELTITPTQTIEIPADLVRGSNSPVNLTSGGTYTIFLNRFQTFLFANTLNLTGSKVVSNKPIAFFSGHECAYVPTSALYCDHLVEQIPPTLTWGRRFFVTSLHLKTAGEQYKLITSTATTTVVCYCYMSGGNVSEVFMTTLYGAGRSYEFHIAQNMFCSVQASSAVLLVQFATGGSLEPTNLGDPFMMMIPPVEQYSNNYTFVTQSNFQNAITITVASEFFNSGRIILNGSSLSSATWTRIYCSTNTVCGYGTVVSVGVGRNFIYHRDPTASFGVYVYGFTRHTSYGYPAGMHLDPISGVCQPGTIQLATTQSEGTGLVQVCLDGSWTYVCGIGWSTADAEVACRHLGYSFYSAIAYTASPGADNTVPLLFSNVRCTGSEAVLTSCLHDSNLGLCTLTQTAAGVTCHMYPTPIVSVGVSGSLFTGNRVTFTCSVEVSVSILNTVRPMAIWRRGTTQLFNNSRTNVSELVSTGTSLFESNLTINSIAAADSGNYNCETTLVSIATNNVVSRNSSMVFIVVEEVEASVMVSGPLYIRRGATLTCSIRVNASLQVLSDINVVTAWMKGNAQLINNNRTDISDTISNGSIFETNVTFIPLQFDDNGNYSCEVTLFSIATGNMLLTRSSVFFFDVQGPRSPPRGLSAYAYGPTVIGLTWSPPPTMDINGVIDYYVVEVNEIHTGRSWTFQATDPHINISSLHPYYIYECQVAVFTFAQGPFTTPFQVVSGEDAPTSPPTNLTIEEFTSDSISLSWDPPPFEEQNGLIRQYFVTITRNDTGMNFQQISNTTEATIQSLHPFSTYIIAVAAETVDVGPFTDNTVVRLPEDVPRAPPLNVSGSVVNSSTIVLNWNPPDVDDQNGIIRYYVVNVTELQTGNMFQFTANATSLTITSLHPAYTYEIAVSAATIGSGQFSPAVTLQTTEAAPSGFPHNFSASVVATHSLSLVWNPPPPEEQNGDIIRYRVNITVLGTMEMYHLLSVSDSITVLSLRPYTTYNFTIAAETAVGVGPFSGAYTVMTATDVPSAPEQPVVSRVVGSPLNLFVTWTSPSEPNGVILSYTVYCYKPTPDLGNGTQQHSGGGSGMQQPDVGDESMYAHTIVPGNETQTVVTGLEPYTTYNCYVVANTSAGVGNPSFAHAATTDESVPGDPPSNFRGTVVNSTAVSLTWSEPLLPHGVITSYTIIYNFTGRQISVTVNARDANIYLLSGLDEFTMYDVFIRASTRVGSGPSASLTVTTNPSYPHAPPENVQTLATTSTTATISWLPPPDEHQNGRIVYYILIITDLGFGTNDVVLNSTAMNATATNLQEFNNYSCIVAAATTVGLGPYSLPIMFTTLQDAPSAPPQSLSVIAVSSMVVILTWSSPPLIDINGIILNYFIRIRERETSRVWIFQTTNSHINITSLHPYYNYECEVAAHTIATGPYTNPVTVQTMEAAPSSPPTNIAVASVSSDSFLLSWDPPPVEDINGVIRNYMITVTEVETGRTFYVTTNTTLLELNGLHPFYMYTSIVAAQTVALGPYSSAISVRLGEEAPTSPPANITGQAVDSTSISISWSPPPFEDQNGIIRHYVINITELDTGITFSRVSLTTSISLYNLHPFYRYSVTVTAVTIGPGPATIAFTVQTREDAPSMPPENLMVEATTSKSITLSWSPPDMQSQNGIITGYLINVTAIGTGETFQVSSTTTNLVIQSLRPFTTYVCVIAAETSAGTGPFSISLTVQTNESAPGAPPEDLVAVSVSSTSFVLSWSPPPTSQQNGIIREYTVNITEIQTGLSIILNSTSTSVSVLSLHPYYTYECTVSAYTVRIGPYSDVFSITTSEDVPSGYPQNIEARAVSSRMSTLSWDPPNYEDRNGIIIGYVINVTNTRRSETLQYTSNTTALTLSTLSPYTTYYCIVAARTSVGIGPFSAVITLDTPQDVPSSPPQTPRGNAMSSTGITLSWDPPPVDEQNGIITRYMISIIELETGRSFSLFSPTTSVNVTSLHPYYTYNCTIAAVTIVGDGPYTTTITIVTLQDPPSGPPQNITGQASSARSLYITWNPPAAAEQNGIITSYTVNITVVETGERLQFTSQSQSANVTGLTPYTTYLCIVAASTAIGPGPFSIQITIRTPEAVPGSYPSNTTGTTLNSTHIYLMWEPPEDPNGDIREYRINVTEEETGRMFQFSTNTTSITIGSLHPYYTYNCTVVAVTIGPGPFSTVITLRTAEDAPSGSPANFQARALDSRSIHLSWDPLPLAQQNGIIRQYRVTIVDIAGEARIISTTATSVNVAALNPLTMYTCTVAAETVAAGPSTSPVEIVTPQDVPTGPPQAVAVRSENSTTLVLSWQPPAPENQNGIIVHYIVNITEMETGRLLSFTAVNTTTLSVTMLHPFYTYTCIVAAVTVGIGPYSTTVQVELPEDAPSSSPVMLTFSNTTDSRFSLVWQDPPPEDQNGIIRLYFINITEEETGRQFQLTSSAPHILVEFLHPSYTYVCTVAASTVTIGPYSPPLTVMTLEAAPSSPPVNINVSSLNSSALIATWEPPMAADRNGAITGYFLNVTNVENDITIQLFTSSTNLIVDMLEPFTAYTVNIAAQTAVDAGPYSIGLSTITMEDAPSGPPVGVTHLEVTSTSVTLSWNTPETSQQNGVIRSYIVIVREEETGRNFSVNSTNTELRIGNLHPFYTYHFTVAAVTISQGPFTNEYVLQTLEDVPSGTPQSIHAQPIDSRSLLLAWEPPLAEEQNGVIQEYLINISVAETGDGFQFQSTNTTLIVEDLHPHYTYSLVISAVTIGPGPYSEVYTVQMPEDAPTAPPENFNLQVVGSRTIVASWRLPLFEERNGVIISYTIVLVELPTNTTLIYQREGNHTELVVEELHPYYEYRCSIVAATQVGAGPSSDLVTVRTAEDVPSSAPVSLQGSAVNSTTIQLQWEPPPLVDQNGVIRSYIVNISVAETGSSFQQTSEATALYILNLHPFYTYTLTVAAVTIGPGPYGLVLTVQMPEDVPSSAPVHLQGTAVNSTTIHLQWQPPLLTGRNGVIRSYLINITVVETGTTLQLTSQTNARNISGLHPYYTYILTVAAVTIGPGPYGLVLTIRMPEDVPSSAPVHLQGSALNSTTIQLQWRPPPLADQNGVIRSYYINISVAETGSIFRLTSVTTAWNISNLHPYYTYTITVAAVTIGPGPYSVALTIRMPENVPSSAPVHLQGRAMNSTAIQIQWEPPPLANQNGVIRSYIINISVAETGSTFQLTAGINAVNISALHPFYTYTITVAAVTIGPGPHGLALNIQTPEDVPTGPPENFTVQVLSSGAVLVSWRPPTFGKRNGVIVTYTIVLVELLSNATLMYEQEGNVSELTVAELHPYYEYKCSMVAATQVGNGPFTGTVTIRTFGDVPSGAPTNITVESLSSTSLMITWEPPAPSQRNGVITQYRLLVTSDSGETEVYDVSGSLLSREIEDLEKYSQYRIQIAAVSSHGTGPPSPAVFVQTNEDLPSAPQNVTGEQLNATAVRLQWDPPESPNGIITGYQVTYYGYRTTFQVQQVQDGMIQVVDGPHHEQTLEYSIVLTNLSPGLTYIFKVRGRTSVGYGENSTALNITLSAEGQTGGLGNSSTTAAVIVVILVVAAIIVVVFIVGVLYHRRKQHKFKEYAVRENIYSNTRELRGTVTAFSNKAALENEKDALEEFTSASSPENSFWESEEFDAKESETSYL